LRPRLTGVSKPRDASDARRTATRAQAAADALGSVRAEGLDPTRAEPLLEAWARGELTDAQLDELSIRLLHDPRLTAAELLSGARAA
jgi:broad specificity phosphatase PhoE